MSVFEGNPPLPPEIANKYCSFLSSLVCSISATADLLCITESQETDKTTCSVLLFVTVMDYVFRVRQKGRERVRGQ